MEYIRGTCGPFMKHMSIHQMGRAIVIIDNKQHRLGCQGNKFEGKIVDISYKFLRTPYKTDRIVKSPWSSI